MSEFSKIARLQEERIRLEKNLIEFAKSASSEFVQRRVQRYQDKLDIKRQRLGIAQEVKLFPPPVRPPAIPPKGQDFAPPFSISIDGTTTKVAKGKYQFGPMDSLHELAEATGTGNLAYFEVTSNWTGSPTVSILITNTTKTPYVLDAGTPQKIEKTYIPIGAIVGGDPVQYFSGNVIFSVWLLQGYAGYWGTTNSVV